MKKLLIALALFIIMPSIIYAEENVEITKIVQTAIDGEPEVLEESTFEGTNINLNLRFFNVGESIEYTVTVKNNTKEKQEMDTASLVPSSKYVTYTVEPANPSIEAGEEIELKLTVKYNELVAPEDYTNSIFTEKENLVINFLNNELVINPNTKAFIPLIVFGLLIVCSLVLYFFSVKRYKFLATFLLLLIPVTVYATSKYQITINSNIEIYENDILFINNKPMALIPPIETVVDNIVENGGYHHNLYENYGYNVYYITTGENAADIYIGYEENGNEHSIKTTLWLDVVVETGDWLTFVGEEFTSTNNADTYIFNGRTNLETVKQFIKEYLPSLDPELHKKLIGDFSLPL